MRHLLILFVFLTSIVGAGENIASEKWKAGVGRAVITPEKPMRMAGYAGRIKHAEGKVHDLWVKALALEDPAGTRALFFTADMIGIGKELSDQIVADLLQAHQLPREAIVIATSHTHTGPVVRNVLKTFQYSEAEQQQIDAYAAALRKNFSKAAADALAGLKPAKIEWGSGKCTFAVNRRDNIENKVPELIAAGALKGPFDHQVPVLRVTGADNSMLAVVFGYACHCTVLDFLQWSGDYAGFAQLELEKAHPGAAAMFFAGCGADQNPLPRRSVELAEKYGRMLADSVGEVLQTEMKPVTGTLALRSALIDLPYAEQPSREKLQEMSADKNAYQRKRGELLLQQLEKEGKLPASYPYPIHVWRLGDHLTFVALGGEVVVDYALRLKKELGAEHTWIAGYCNDVMAYIPSLRVLKEGGYEGRQAMMYFAHPSHWGSQIEELIVAKVHELTEQVRQKK